MTFTIRPLVWEGHETNQEAVVPGGYYHVRARESWERRDEDSSDFLCEYYHSGCPEMDFQISALSMDNGKAIAQSDWIKRITPALEPVEDGGMPVKLSPLTRKKLNT